MAHSPIPVAADVVDSLIVQADGQEAVKITLWTALASDGAASDYKRRPTAWLQVSVDKAAHTWRFGGQRYQLARQAFRDLCVNVARPAGEKLPVDRRTGLIVTA